MLWGFPFLMLLWGSGQSPALPPPRDPDPEPAPEEEEEEEGEGEEEGDRAPIPSIPPQQQGGDWASVSFPRTNGVSPFFLGGGRSGAVGCTDPLPPPPLRGQCCSCCQSAMPRCQSATPAALRDKAAARSGIWWLLVLGFAATSPAARFPRGHGLGHPNRPPRTTRLLGSCRLVVI